MARFLWHSCIPTLPLPSLGGTCLMLHKFWYLFVSKRIVVCFQCKFVILEMFLFTLATYVVIFLCFNVRLLFCCCFQTKLHFSRWNGVGKDYPVHYVSLWDIFERNPWSFLGYCTVVHNSQLGKGVPHLDRVECGCVSWESSKPADHSVVWNVFQRSTGKSSLCSYSGFC